MTIDPIVEKLDTDLATVKEPEVVKATPQETEMQRLEKLYTKDQIIKGLFNRIQYLEGELKNADGERMQLRNELGRMRQILDGYVRDQHKHSDDVKKDARNRHNLTVTALFGKPPAATTSLVILGIVCILVLAFVVLLENPNFTSGLHSIVVSKDTELLIAIVVLAMAACFIGYLRWFRRR